MTREELKTHCEKQIEMCEFWAIGKGEKPSGKIYEEHNLILELLEQETLLDKVRAEIAEYGSIWVEYKITGRSDKDIEQLVSDVLNQAKDQVLDVIDKYKAESKMDADADKGVLEKINEKQDSLKAVCKAWDEEIEKYGYVN